ncbi:MAG TPA: RNA-binding cell elongation regulator Jag/EloR [Candidatus Binatia bacterium]|jgi:spoIIIJ-associated protein
MDHVEAEGETIDEAIAKALKMLGVERDRVTIDILAEARKGVLGIGGKKARVRASLRRPVADDAEEERPRSEPIKEKIVNPAEVAAAAEKGKRFLAEVLRLLEVDAAIAVKPGDTPVEVVLEVQGDFGGLLIGRNGQTLEALQYLLTRAVSETRGREGVQLEVDSENYRDRRRKSLQDMALRLGEKAKRQRKTVTVDPLSAADRRVVHTALQDDPWLTTKSLGAGAYRRMLIIPEGDRKRKEEAKPQPSGKKEMKEQK